MSQNGSGAGQGTGAMTPGVQPDVDTTKVKILDLPEDTLDSPNKQKPEAVEGSLEEAASCFSVLTLSWFGRLLALGTTRPLQLTDCGKPAADERASATYVRFQKLWEDEVDKEGIKDASLHKVIIAFVGKIPILWCLLFTAIQTGFKLGIPLLSKRLIQSLEGMDPLERKYEWCLVVSLLMFPLIGGFFEGMQMLMAHRYSKRIYGALTTAVFYKAMTLSSHARNQASTGRIVTLMSNDAGTTMEQVLHQTLPVFVALPQFIIVAILLGLEMGVSLLAGLGLVFFSVPFSLVVFGKVAYFTQRYSVLMDNRMKLVNDFLSGIRVVKAYAWERTFVKMLAECRVKEVRMIRSHGYWTMVGLSSLFMQIPMLMQLITYSVYTWLGGEVTASRLFTAMQFFQMLNQPLMSIPTALTALSNYSVAVERLGSFLKLHEVTIDPDDERLETPAPAGGNAIEIRSAEFAWAPEELEAWQTELPENKVEKAAAAKLSAKKAEEEKAEGKGEEETQALELATTTSTKSAFTLKDISMSVPHGSLVGVAGPVGSGKSSLLEAVLNEMHKLAGTVAVRGRVAYASQQAWIRNATLKENVIFHAPWDEAWYQTVLNASALIDDIRIMPDGDMTEIGERGINLSGGQKMRVGLARALYARSDIILLDDPLAAVDTHVADHIFQEAILKVLKGSTVILVTNQLHRLPFCDHVLAMTEGTITEQGTFEDLVASKGAFSKLMERQGVESIQNHVDEECEKGESKSEEGVVNGEGATKAKSLHEEEEREEGKVDWRVYLWYAKHVGYPLFGAVWFFITCQTFLPVFGMFEMQDWTNAVIDHQIANLMTGGTDSFSNNSYYLERFAAFMLAGTAATLVSSLCSAIGRARAAKTLHEGLTQSMARVPVDFFDTTPLGRILNRFSKDMQSVDMILMVMVTWALVTLNLVFSSFFGIIYSTKGVLAVIIVPIAIVYIKMLNFVRCSAVELQRIQAISRSPIYSAFSELLTGLSTVRAFGAEEHFEAAHVERLDKNLIAIFLSQACVPAWLAMRLQCMGALILFGVGLLSLVWPEMSSAGSTGLGITYAFNISHMMLIAVFVFTTVETQMNSVERLKHYSENLKFEAAEIIEETAPAEDWPNTGSIQIENLVMGYREGPDVLKGISADIKPSEKVGIVGRTGSGKSTLLLALFRLVEARQGRIVIDGIDIRTLGVRQLRSRLGIIPQDPVLFVGSMRYNLDPFNNFSDEQVWAALEQVQLRAVVEGLENGLDEEVQENGSNFSVGQRQLVCIARALLLDPRVLMLDEATASIDSETDALLQKMIRTSFRNQTVLCIAHRLDTIMDYDRVLVLRDGLIAEFDSPANLLKDPDGVFTSMVQAGNEEHLVNLVQGAPSKGTPALAPQSAPLGPAAAALAIAAGVQGRPSQLLPNLGGPPGESAFI